MSGAGGAGCHAQRLRWGGWRGSDSRGRGSLAAGCGRREPGISTERAGNGGARRRRRPGTGTLLMLARGTRRRRRPGTGTLLGPVAPPVAPEHRKYTGRVRAAAGGTGAAAVVTLVAGLGRITGAPSILARPDGGAEAAAAVAPEARSCWITGAPRLLARPVGGAETADTAAGGPAANRTLPSTEPQGAGPDRTTGAPRLLAWPGEGTAAGTVAAADLTVEGPRDYELARCCRRQMGGRRCWGR